MDHRFLRLEDFIRTLEAEVAPTGVTVSGGLLSSRKWEERHESLQGIISAMHLAKWEDEHGRHLFDDNVRVEMDSEVNKEMVRYILKEPQNFWYFNNGITALYETWESRVQTPRRYRSASTAYGSSTGRRRWAASAGQ